jgi:hypothetical protein
VWRWCPVALRGWGCQRCHASRRGVGPGGGRGLFFRLSLSLVIHAFRRRVTSTPRVACSIRVRFCFFPSFHAHIVSQIASGAIRAHLPLASLIISNLLRHLSAICSSSSPATNECSPSQSTPACPIPTPLCALIWSDMHAAIMLLPRFCDCELPRSRTSSSFVISTPLSADPCSPTPTLGRQKTTSLNTTQYPCPPCLASIALRVVSHRYPSDLRHIALTLSLGSCPYPPEVLWRDLPDRSAVLVLPFPSPWASAEAYLVLLPFRTRLEEPRSLVVALAACPFRDPASHKAVEVVVGDIPPALRWGSRRRRRRVSHGRKR